MDNAAAKRTRKVSTVFAPVNPTAQTVPVEDDLAEMARLNDDATVEIEVYRFKANRGDVSADTHREASERLREGARKCLDRYLRRVFYARPEAA